MIVRVGLLVRAEAGAALHDEPLRVDEPAALARLGLRRTLGDHRRDGQVGDAGRGLAGAHEQDLLVGELAAGDAQRRDDARERHRRGALDVVVERADALAVPLQQPERVVVGEVLELHDDAGEDLLRRRDEFVDQLVVRGARDALLLQPDVERVRRAAPRCWCPCRG